LWVRGVGSGGGGAAVRGVMIVEHKHCAYSKHNFFFTCFFCTIACLEVEASSTVVRGSRFVPVHCGLVAT
jgi:hypothetical protein